MRRRLSPVTIEAPAKINLRLVVLAPEVSGYHTLETVLCGISLADRLTLEPAGQGIQIDVEGDINPGPAEQNLAVRAAQAFFEVTGEEPNLRITLLKRIPVAAGLGGGSSDAAAVLRGLDAMYSSELSREQLARMALSLGSDVPFFMASTPYALAWGRGQRILELEPLPARPVLLVNPGRRMPTADAFKRLAALREGDTVRETDYLPLVALQSWDGIRQIVMNDFEAVAFDRFSKLPNVARSFLEFGAGIALLSGSGPTVFGVFESTDAADRAEAILDARRMRSWRCDTLIEWPRPQPAD